MPTQIQGLVTPVYEPVVTVPSTSEVITETALTDTALALANRIEYVRQLTLAEQESPEEFLFLSDDFYPGAYVTADALLHTELTWRVNEGSSLTQGPVTNDAQNPGTHFATLTTGEDWAMSLGEQLIFGIRLELIEQLTWIFKLTCSNFTSAKFFIGLGATISTAAEGGDDSIGLLFDHSIHATNWLIRHYHGGTPDITSTPQAVVSGAFVIFKILRISATQLEVYLNGTLRATLTHGTTAPTAATPLNIGALATAGVATLTPALDKMALRGLTPGRQT